MLSDSVQELRALTLSESLTSDMAISFESLRSMCSDREQVWHHFDLSSVSTRCHELHCCYILVIVARCIAVQKWEIRACCLFCDCIIGSDIKMMFWLNGNVHLLDQWSYLCRDQLVLGWVTICGYTVNSAFHSFGVGKSSTGLSGWS